MPSPGAPPARSLEDFVRFFRALEQAAIDFVVIGGCAVGAYARLAGLRVISSDLDLYVSEAALRELLSWARAARVTIEKLPSPRAVPVAVLSWDGMETNALTASTGLPAPEVAERSARDFELSQHGISIPVADPFDLLSNKLALKRPKDIPHIEVLTQFVATEVVTTFADVSSPRRRLSAARRYLAVFGLSRLPESLIDSLLPVATDPALRRFLMSVAPTRDHSDRVFALAEDDTSELSCFGSGMQAEMDQLDDQADASDEVVRLPANLQAMLPESRP